MNPSRRAGARSIGIGLATAAGVTLAAAAGSAALAAVMARRVVTPETARAGDVRVLGIAETSGRITLSRTPDTELEGCYGLWFGRPERYLRLGPVIRVGESEVVRELPPQDLRGLPGSGPATLSSWVYRRPEELGIPHRSVLIPVAGGNAPAWLFPAPTGEGEDASAPWAVIVHGRGTTREEGLRAVPLFHAAGYHTLVVSYRNDSDAPRSGDGLYRLGETEWRDVECALDLAVARGARRIVVMGWSMGGAIALQLALGSRHRALIDALVLESPVVDWRSVLDFQGAERHLPAPIRSLAMGLLEASWARPVTGLGAPLNLDRLDLVGRAEELDRPILLLHSIDDGFVPADASLELARARPDLVELEEFRVARHTKLWNYDPARWEGAIARFLADRGARAAAARARIDAAGGDPLGS